MGVKALIIVECERCNSKLFIETDTFNKEHGSRLAGKAGLRYSDFSRMYLCEVCHCEEDELIEARKTEVDKFKRNE